MHIKVWVYQVVWTKVYCYIQNISPEIKFIVPKSGRS